MDVNGEPIDAADLEIRGADVALDGSAIEPGTRVYDVKLEGNTVAQYTTTTAREEIDGVQAVRSTAEMAGMGGGTKQEVAFEAATFRPLFSRVEQQMGAQTLRIDLRLEDARVIGTVEVPGTEARDVAIDAVPGMLLPGMETFAIMVADLDATKRFRMPLVSAQSGTLTAVEFELVGETTVAVAAGEFDAYEVEVSGGPTPQRLFVRKAAPHILLRQEVAGQPITIELKGQK